MIRHALTAVVAVVVCAAVANPAVAQMGASFAVPKRFIAHPATKKMKVYSGSGLACSFDRDYETIHPDGTTADDDEARFDREVLIAAVPDAYTTEKGGGTFLASGVDASGEVELLLHYETSEHRFNIFEDGEWARDYVLNDDARMGPLSCLARNMEVGDPGPLFLDVLKNEWEEGAKALEPFSAVIIHGAMIVAGSVWIGTTEENHYETRGWGFAMSTDNGATWSLEWDDTNQSQLQLYHARGQDYCLRAAVLWDMREDPHPTSFFICCTDYMHRNSEVPPSWDAATGRVYFARLTRPAGTSDVWALGSGTTHKVKRFDLAPPLSPPPVKPLNHAHACLATEWQAENSEAEGVQLVAATGDGRQHNRIIRFTLEDHTSDYTTATWTWQDDYHGAAAPNSGTDLESTESFQPIGAAQGAGHGEVIWGTDLRSEWILRMRLPVVEDPEEVDQARFDHLYGYGTSFGHNGLRPWPAVTFNQPHPELAAGPITGVYTHTGLTGSEIDDNRVLYCPNSSQPELWAQVGSWRPAPSAPHPSAFSAAVHHGGVYLSGQFHGLKRRPKPSFSPSQSPTLMSIRPILIAPGGQNMLVADYFIEQEDAFEFEELLKGVSGWEDGRPLPDPPCMGERAIKIRSFRDDDSGFEGNVRVSSSNDQSWNETGFPNWATGGTARVRRVRGWVLDGSYDRGGLSEPLSPNKTNQLALRVWDELTSGAAADSWYSCDNRWIPCTNISLRGLAANTGLALRFNAFGQEPLDVDAEEANYGYFLPEIAMDGSGSLPYPMLPETEGENEHMEITGFTLGTTQSWWVKVAGMMPIGNWDHYSARETSNGSGVSGRKWPLLTLWGDENRYIEFVADCENKGFLVRYKKSSSSSGEEPFGARQIWMPDSPLLLAFGYNSTTGKLVIGASLGGDLVQVSDEIDWTSGSNLTEIRFRGPGTSSNPAGGEVCEFRWIGGEINNGASLTTSTMPAAFEDLGFLYVP